MMNRPGRGTPDLPCPIWRTPSFTDGACQPELDGRLAGAARALAVIALPYRRDSPGL